MPVVVSGPELESAWGTESSPGQPSITSAAVLIKKEDREGRRELRMETRVGCTDHVGLARDFLGPRP